MKRKITQAEFDALSEALQALYKQDGDSWILQLEDDPAFDALKEEKRKEKEAREAAEAELAKRKKADDDAAEALRVEREKAAKAAGDVEALEKSWKEKHEADVAAAKAAGTQATSALKSIFINKVAADLAAEISTVPDLMVDKIKARLDLEIADGTPITRVLDVNGKPSALSLDDLKKEFVDNKSYAAIIKASDAQGGGAGAGNDGNGVPGKKLSEMTATEEAKFANDHPAEYARLVNGG